ncbi:MAG: hypothetical protein IJ668_06570 [Selenomonadaceae bacterium]|nr:hypothetical protein [Selenomonadaceae bacterium]
MKFNFESHFGFTLEKLVLILGFAMLSFFIVLIAGFSYDIKFMTVFARSVKAFFVAGIAAFIAVGVLSIQEKYFGVTDEHLKPPEQQSTAPPQQNNPQ